MRRLRATLYVRPQIESRQVRWIGGKDGRGEQARAECAKNGSTHRIPLRTCSILLEPSVSMQLESRATRVACRRCKKLQTELARIRESGLLMQTCRQSLENSAALVA